MTAQRRPACSSTSTDRTSSTPTREAIFDHLSQFTEWRPYEHRVLAQVDGQLLPIPINLDTVNQLYGLSLHASTRSRHFFASRAEPVDADPRRPRTWWSSRVGRDLYEKFFRGYTRKQWGVDPSELDKSVTARVPVRTQHGRPLFHRHVTSSCRCTATRGCSSDARSSQHQGDDADELRRKSATSIPHRRLIYTGPGRRVSSTIATASCRIARCEFEHETLDQEWCQAVAVVNYPQTHAYTRVTEYKHLTGQTHPMTSARPTSIRAPRAIPYYPIPMPENAELYRRYEALARRDAGRVVRRAARDLSLLQHGPGGRAGAGDVPEDPAGEPEPARGPAAVG